MSRLFARSAGPPRGLTLVELLAALALLAILSLTLLALTRATARDAAVQSGAAQPPAWRERLARRLTQDLEQSLSAAPTPNGLLIEGWNDHDPDTLAPRHRPVRVVWRVDQGALWRESTPLNREPGAGPASSRRLVAAGVVDWNTDQSELQMDFDDPAAPPLRLTIPRGTP